MRYRPTGLYGNTHNGEGGYRQTLHLFCGLFNTYTIDAKLNEHESKQPTYYPNANLNLEQAQRRIPQ